MLGDQILFTTFLLQVLFTPFVISQTAFPIRQFFDDEAKNATSNSTLRVEIYTENTADEYLCNRNSLCCSCKDKCLKYHDCCIDRMWNMSNPMELDVYVSNFIKQSKQYKETSCTRILPNPFYQRGFYSETIYMVTTCNEHASTHDTNECVNSTLQTNAHIIPVLGDDGFVYRNSFCARCNFIQTFQVLNLTANCESNDPFPQFPPLVESRVFVGPGNSTIITTTTTTTTTTTPKPSGILEQFKICSFEIVRNNITRNYIDTCANVISRDGCLRGNPYYDLCHAYTGYFQGERNYHCFLCKSTNPEAEKMKPRLYQCQQQFAERVTPNSWSHILSLNFGRSGEITTNGLGFSRSKSVCENGFYNILTEKCESFSCEQGYKRVGSQCIQDVYINNPTFENCLLQTGGGFMYFIAMSNKNATTYQNAIISSLNASFSPKADLFYKNESHIIFEVVVNKSHHEIQSLLHNISQPSHVLWRHFNEIYLVSNKVLKSELYQFNIERSFKGDRFCSNPTVINHVNNTISNECHYTHDNDTFDYLNTTYWIFLSRYQHTQLVSVCKNFHLHSKCPLNIISSNFSVINKSLVLHPSNKTYPPSDYAPLENGIGICRIIEDPLADWLKLSADIEYNFSVVVTSISVVCLAVICLTYCYFKELKNLPGLNVIGFTFTLLVSDITFIISIATDVNNTHCKNMAIFLHWVLIVSYFWVIIIAFDLTTTFSSQTKAMSSSPKNTFMKYVIFVISVPTVFISISIALNESDEYVFGYGEHNVCFITRFFPRLYFYAIPVFVINLVTLTCFTIAIVSIYRTDKISRRTLHKKQSINLLKIGVKLAIILGFIELIGFLQISKSNLSDNERLFNSITALMYTVVRSSKGIFLFIIYMLNRQKYKLLMREFKKLRHVTETSRSYEMTVSTTA